MKRTDLDLASRALGGSVRIVSDEFFAACEALIQPGPPVHDTPGIRSARQDLRRLGDPPAAHPRLRLGRRGPRCPGRAASDHRRHRLFHRELPAGGFPRGHLGGRARPNEDLAAADWSPWCRNRPPGEHGERLPGTQPLGVHPRPAEHLSRRRRRPAAGTRHPGARSAGARRAASIWPPCTTAARSPNARTCSIPTPDRCSIPASPGPCPEGWETARRRTAGNDYLVVTLAGPSRLSYVDIDTGYFLGNAPGRVRLSGRSDEGDPWREILPETPISPDGHNRFRLTAAETVSAVRVDVFPGRRLLPPASDG